MKRILNFIKLDLSDVTKPYGFDIFILIIGLSTGTLLSLQSFFDAHSIAEAVLQFSLFMTVLLLAMRSVSGLTNLIQTGVFSLYLTYPLSRLSIISSLLLSRIFLASLMTLSVPVVVSIALFPSLVFKSLSDYLLIFIGYYVQVVMYGLFFSLFALKLKSPGTTGLASIAFFFVYNVLSPILLIIGFRWDLENLVKLGRALILNDIIISYVTGSDLEAWQLFIVPIISLLLLLYVIHYFVRRFEPI